MKRIVLTLAVVLASFVAVGSAQAQYPSYGHHHHHHGYYGGYGYGVVPPVRVYANFGTPYYNNYGVGAYNGYAPGAYVAPYTAGYGGYGAYGNGYVPAPGVVYPQRGVGMYYGY